MQLPPTSSLCAALALVLVPIASAQTAYVEFEGPQTHPVRLAPDGSRLFAANTAADRLSVFSLANPASPVLVAEIPVGLQPIAVNARTSDEVWVVNHLSDSVSIVSVAQGIVTDTLRVADEPGDVVFAGSPQRAFVTAARSNQVRVFDVTTHAQLASIALSGNHPRALAVSADGSKVYTAFLLSGNRTTCVPRASAPPQPPPTNPLLPAPPQVGLIVDATDPAWSPAVIRYTVLDHDVAEIDANTLTLVRYFDRTGTTNFDVAVQPGTGDVWVANTDARNLVRFETALRGHTVDNRITRVTTGATPAITAVDLNPGVNYAVLPNPAATATALSQPTAIAFEASGAAWVASFGTDRVARLDASGNVLARVQIGPVTGVDSRNLRGPRGLALHASGAWLYVQNRVANTLSVVDTAALAEVRELAIGAYDPTPLAVREGRGFLYDAKLSGNGTNSCASCHIDGDTDAIAWDLGNPGGSMTTVTDPQTGATFQMHPMKGPMVTQVLRGLAGMAPYHWRGDKADLNAFNAAFDGLMGGSQVPAADMQAFSDFMSAVAFEGNPNQNLDRTLPAALAGFNPQTGLVQYNQTPSPIGGPACGSCHPQAGAPFPRIVQNPPAGSIVAKAMPMRDFYRRWLLYRTTLNAQNLQGYGFEHDGTLDEISAFAQLNNIRAFFACMDTTTAPIVGYTRTISSSNAGSASIVNDVNLFVARTAALDCDLVGKGVVDGLLRGLLYDRTSGLFTTDRTGVGPFTWAQLQGRALAGNATFSLIAVPPGSGTRIGVDRDLDLVLDADELPATPLGTSFCSGDGTLATPGPCGNVGASGRGCANSAESQGALLAAFGATSPETAVLVASGMPATSSAIYLKGDADNGAGAVFGDGVRCVDGILIRLRTRFNLAGTSRFPEGGEVTLSTRGATPPGSGFTAYYQTYYRNASSSFCPPETFNVSNGVFIVW
ncbi:MAG: hypothetical protein HZA53_06760 [Planctomycetes bacterium]|nr:hypothetical protein [Planctomycetota bacterium]